MILHENACKQNESRNRNMTQIMCKINMSSAYFVFFHRIQSRESTIYGGYPVNLLAGKTCE